MKTIARVFGTTVALASVGCVFGGLLVLTGITCKVVYYGFMLGWTILP